MRLHVPAKYAIPLFLIGALATLTFASSVSVTSSSYSAQQGVVYQVTGDFSASSNGFATAGSTVSASSQPCSWTNGGTCTTALIAGHYYYGVTLTLNNVPASTTTYTATIYWSQNGGAKTQMGTLNVSVPTTAVAGQTMTFNFDSGVTSFTAPVGIDITVQ